MDRCARLFLLMSLLAFLHFRNLPAQVTTKISSVEPSEAIRGAPVTVRVMLQQTEAIERITLLYRPFGESEYRRGEMDITGNAAIFTLPAGVVLPPYLEYYVVITNRTGDLETYPISESANPFVTPPSRTVRLPVLDDDEALTDIVFLSPERQGALSAEDVVVSVSLLRIDSSIERNATIVLLDGADVTAGTVISDDLIVLVPDNLGFTLSPGLHRVTVQLFDRKGELNRSASIPFVVLGDAQFLYAAPKPGGLRYDVSAQVESRHEEVQSVGTWYNRGNIKATARAGDWRIASNLFITSDENRERQPQNRYFAGVESSWLRAGYGDSYPSFPDLILSGKRVRGLNAGLRFGFFNLDVALGSTIRAIDGALIRSFPTDSFGVEYSRDPSAIYGRIDAGSWGKFAYGTYARNIFAIRPSWGSGKTWQFGLTFLKGKDDVSSIHYGIRPQENVILGTDFKWKSDEGRIELSGQGAFSAYNSDISGGAFTDAYIDSVYREDAASIKSARDILAPYITVNENLRPLSLKKMSTVAYDVILGLNYLDNAFKATYLFRGSDYTSFGQSFLRKDVRGFNVLDRVRLLTNEVFLSLGYERLEDNTSDSKAATTAYSTVNAALSYYPRDQMPTVTVGFARYANDNGITAAAASAVSIVDDATNRYFLQSSYDFTWLARNTATLNFSTSDRTDNSPQRQDVHNLTLSLGVSSRFVIPLQTTFDISVNTNDLPPSVLSGPRRRLNYTTFSLSGKYALLPDEVTVSAAMSPSFGDFVRNVLEVGTEWFALPSASFLFQFTYVANDGLPSDNFVSLRCRYDLE